MSGTTVTPCFKEKILDVMCSPRKQARLVDAVPTLSVSHRVIFELCATVQHEGSLSINMRAIIAASLAAAAA